MRTIWTIFKREMMAYFYSPIAYLMGGCTLLMTGVNFVFIINIINGEPGGHTVSDWFFNGFFTWIILLGIIPFITMRLFAEERRAGIWEGIMTAPIRDIEYVMGKYLSALAFYVILWMPTASYLFILRYFAKDVTYLDMGPLWGGYLGLFLLGMLWIASGCFASSITRNQIIAAIVTLAINLSLFLLGFIYYYNQASPHVEYLRAFALHHHLVEFSRGLVDYPRVVFYLSGSMFFIFLTHRSVQTRQWKS